MKNWSEKLQKTFGLEACPEALFYEFEFALRFELGGERFGMNQPIRRFLQAHQRASSIAETVFGNATNIQAFIKSWGDSKGPASDFSRLKFVLPKVGRTDFNHNRPHTSLDGLTPVEYVNRSKEDQNLNRANLN